MNYFNWRTEANRRERTAILVADEEQRNARLRPEGRKVDRRVRRMRRLDACLNVAMAIAIGAAWLALFFCLGWFA